jgi:AcrR family transcriptional regulator
MDTIDRRVKRTHKLLVEALIGLSLEKGYDTVTIRDIADRADIAYSTFFRHYSDKEALLREIVGDAVTTLYSLIGELPEHLPEEEGKLLFQHVEQHESFYRVIFSGQGVNRVMEQVQQEIQRVIIEAHRQKAQSDIPLEIVANHIMTSILSLIKWWLDHGKPYPVARMAYIYSELIIKATESAIGIHR